MKILKLSCIVVFLIGSRVEVRADSLSSCNDLLSGLSSEATAAIHDLAKFRYNLDQRLTRGENDPVTRALQTQYIEKEKQVLAATQLDRAILMAKLHFEIEAIQNNVAIEASKRVEAKNVEEQENEVIETKVQKIGSLLTARCDYALTALNDGRLLISGGRGNSTFLKSIEIFDPKTGKTELLGELTEGRRGHSQVLLSNDQVLVVGGNGAYTIKSFEVINLKTGKSEVVGELKAARKEYTLSVLPDGRILVAGGASGGVTLKSIEIIDPKTWESNLVGELLEARQGHTQSVLPNGKVLFAGGMLMIKQGQGAQYLSTIEVFDPSTGTSEFLTQMAQPRVDHRQSLLKDGRVLLVGGSNGEGGQPSIEVIDPKTKESKIVGSLLEARWGHTQATLPDGRVVLVAGQNKAILKSIEVIDPDTWETKVVGDLDEPRKDHAQVMLPNGKIVIAGGQIYKDSPLIELIQVERK